MASPDSILKSISQLETRLFERIDHRLTEEMRALRLDINGSFDALHRRIDHLEIEYEMLKAGVARLEADVGTLKAGLGRLEGEMAQVRAAIARLEAAHAEDRTQRERLREEVDGLRLRLANLDDRVRELEGRLKTR